MPKKSEPNGHRRASAVVVLSTLLVAAVLTAPTRPARATTATPFHMGWPQFDPPTPVPSDPPRMWSGGGVAIGDVTGDGRNDVVRTTPYDPNYGDTARRVYVYAQQPDGSLSQAASYPIPAESTNDVGWQVKTADYDRDGLTDVLVAGNDAGILLYRQVPGTGMLAEPTVIADLPAIDLRVADLNRDGRLDLVVMGPSSRLTVLLATDSGFQSSVIHDGPWPVLKGFDVGDVTGDGQLDVVSLLADPTAVRVYTQQPDGTFVTLMHVSLGKSTIAGGFAVGDVTGDGRPDVIISSLSEPVLYVLPMPPQGPIGPWEVHPSWYSARVAVADVNQDGRNDVVANPVVFLGQPDGTLGPALAHASDMSRDMAVGDINSDGLPDLVVVGFQLVVVYHTRDPVPWVLGSDPVFGQAGVPLTYRPTLHFGRALDPGSLSPGTLGFGARGGTFRYNPSAGTLAMYSYTPLIPGGSYTLTVPASVKDSHGTPMPQPFTMQFTADDDPRDPTDGYRPSLRFSGGNRYETAAAIAEDLGAADTALIARGDVPFDALAGTYLAGVRHAPVLLTDPHALPAATLTALQRLGVKNVVLLGGESAISSEIQQQLAARYTVTRIKGTDRYDTAVGIAASGNQIGGFNDHGCAIVATGRQPYDALAAGSLAAGKLCPLLLTEPDALPRSTIEWLRSKRPAIFTIVVAGGAAAVSDVVVQQLKDAGFSPVRVSGNDRYETAAALALYSIEQARLGVGASQRPVGVALARGDDAGGGIDALGLAAYAGIRQSPVLLVSPNQLPEATRTWLELYRGVVSLAYVAGGPQAVAPEVATAARAAITPAPAG